MSTGAEDSKRHAAALARALMDEDRGYAAVFTDADGVITGWSVAASVLTGWSASEAIGQNVALGFTPDDRAKGLASYELRAARETGQSEDERWHPRKDGGQFWASGITIWSPDELGGGFVKIFKDATHRRARAHAMENQLNAQRIHRQAQFAKVVHELRGPLAPLRSAFEILLRDNDSATSQKLRPMIDRQMKLLARQVEDLVDLTRANSGKLHVRVERVDLVELLASAVESCQEFALRQAIALRAILPAGPLMVEVDPIRMTQVMTNLINNALKFSPPGSEVAVLATMSSAHALLQVRDQGIGISAELLPRIFDMFTQAEDSQHSPASGLGVGLAVVREIVRLHGGSVEVRSDGPGKGSEFFVHIPVEHASGDDS